MQHAVWIKNRTPARALRKKDAKTPYEALKGDKPTLTRERIWGSRAYITCIPPGVSSHGRNDKTAQSRGWLGYFVGYKSEGIYSIYSPEKHKVYRIGIVRVEDGEGLDDPHDAPCLEDRVPTLSVETLDRFSSKNEEETSDNDDNDNYAHPSPERVNFVSNSETETVHQAEVLEADVEDYVERIGLGTTFRYFGQFRHADMAKRKDADVTERKV